MCMSGDLYGLTLNSTIAAEIIFYGHKLFNAADKQIKIIYKSKLL